MVPQLDLGVFRHGCVFQRQITCGRQLSPKLAEVLGCWREPSINVYSRFWRAIVYGVMTYPILREQKRAAAVGEHPMVPRDGRG
jgi:hypothetical protein